MSRENRLEFVTADSKVRLAAEQRISAVSGEKAQTSENGHKTSMIIHIECRLHQSLSFLVQSNWETGASESHSRASLAPVSQLLREKKGTAFSLHRMPASSVYVSLVCARHHWSPLRLRRVRKVMIESSAGSTHLGWWRVAYLEWTTSNFVGEIPSEFTRVNKNDLYETRTNARCWLQLGRRMSLWRKLSESTATQERYDAIPGDIILTPLRYTWGIKQTHSRVNVPKIDFKYI